MALVIIKNGVEQQELPAADGVTIIPTSPERAALVVPQPLADGSRPLVRKAAGAATHDKNTYLHYVEQIGAGLAATLCAKHWVPLPASVDSYGRATCGVCLMRAQQRENRGRRQPSAKPEPQERRTPIGERFAHHKNERNDADWEIARTIMARIRERGAE